MSKVLNQIVGVPWYVTSANFGMSKYVLQFLLHKICKHYTLSFLHFNIEESSSAVIGQE